MVEDHEFHGPSGRRKDAKKSNPKKDGGLPSEGPLGFQNKKNLHPSQARKDAKDSPPKAAEGFTQNGTLLPPSSNPMLEKNYQVIT